MWWVPSAQRGRCECRTAECISPAAGELPLPGVATGAPKAGKRFLQGLLLVLSTFVNLRHFGMCLGVIFIDAMQVLAVLRILPELPTRTRHPAHSQLSEGDEGSNSPGVSEEPVNVALKHSWHEQL
ncbi:unnamed protein product [Durusdinium trenchii]|uniref:Uncharacterized protein n=1 Tax=Durusdinium trenchii TaxID=1381693 RepID=A0ABP0M3R7_9DINO